MTMSPDFESFAADVGFSVTVDPEGVVVANEGGEIRFCLTESDHVFRLARGERAGDDVEIMVSDDAPDPFRYLVAELGWEYRAKRGLSRVLFPYEWEDVAPGFEPVRLDGGWTTLLAAGSEPIGARVVDNDMHPIVQFSYLVGWSVDELVASFRASDARPALSLLVSGSGGGRTT